MPGGKRALATYLDGIVGRLNKEDFAPEAEEVTETIAPSIQSSVQRLSAGAPQELREQLHACFIAFHEKLEEEGVDALAELRDCAGSCLAVVSPEGEAEEESEDEADDEPPADPDPQPTEEELATLGAVISRLWAIDEPCRLSSRDGGFRLNHQSRAASVDSCVDRASAPLFEDVDRERLLRNPCSSAFIALLDNYVRTDGVSETASGHERMEMSIFMKKLMGTPHMRYAHNVLVRWGKADPDPRKFSAAVYEIWFTTYGKGRGPKCSSGFEHVFVGEEKQGHDGSSSIAGFHNWIQFQREERLGRVNYRGYVGSLDEDDDTLVSVRFDWGDQAGDDGETKSVSSFLVGSSVAFEFAMLTCAFLGFDGEASVSGLWFGKAGPVKLQTYSWRTSLGTVVKTAYLEG